MLFALIQLYRAMNYVMRFKSFAFHKCLHSGSYKEDAHLTGIYKTQDWTVSPYPCKAIRLSSVNQNFLLT